MKDRMEILKLLKSAKEAELEAIKQLMEMESEEAEETGKKPAKADTKGKKAKEEEEADTDTEDYESMSSKDLYALCCKRGISSKCKNGRSKAELIKVLKANDKVTDEPEEEPADDEDWGEEESVKDYTSMRAKELYEECMSRGIKTKPRLKSVDYIKLLEADDAKGSDSQDDEEDWTID